MASPTLTINLAKIEHNTGTIVSLCRRHHITVAGVTKAVCGMPQVARAMRKGGAVEIGESRLKNIHRLRKHGIASPLMLLRTPSLSRVDEVVSAVDISLNSEITVIKALADTATKRHQVHEIILMVDLGDLREGIWPDELIPLAKTAATFPGLKITGIGTNLTCYSGVVPTPQNMASLIEYAHGLEHAIGTPLRYLSGGNSSALPLLISGQMPPEINHLRIGEAILLGRETIHRRPLPGTFQDAFSLSAEIIELKQKPSLPIGEVSEDAFGTKPMFKNQGNILRAILNVGREDVDVQGLTPKNHHLTILGASSDHLILDVTGLKPTPQVGDLLAFEVNYAALLAAMTSEYVEKKIESH